jgi:hypothetical protein
MGEPHEAGLHYFHLEKFQFWKVAYSRIAMKQTISMEFPRFGALA